MGGEMFSNRFERILFNTLLAVALIALILGLGSLIMMVVMACRYYW